MGTNVLLINPNEGEFKQEDLCIGVKLEVKRKTKSIYDNGEILLVYETYQNIKYNDAVSCFDSSLKTNYMEDSAVNLIGIKQIGIKYNSWYVPEVNITMVDVRGKGLFNDLESNSESSEALMSSLFTFPYPEFYLTIKGVYGKAVKFRLTVQDVRSRFDSGDGNFIIDVKLIGSMYNMFTDVPMHFLLITPYVKYNNFVHNLGFFKDGNYAQIPTLMELYYKILEIEVLGNEDIYQMNMNNWDDNIKRCKRCINHINGLIINISKSRDNIIELSKKNKDVLLIKGSKALDTETYIEEVREFLNDIDKLNENLKNDNPTGMTYTEIKVPSLEIFREGKDEDIPSIVESRSNGVNQTLTVDIGLTPLKNTYEKTIALLTDRKHKQEELKKENTLKQFKDSFGFELTLSNFLIILSSHLKSLNGLYKHLLRNIQNSDRITNKYNLLNIKSGLKEITIQPFPFLFDKGSNSDYWFTESNDPIISNLEERFFIESIVDSLRVIEEVKGVYDNISQYNEDLMVVPKCGIPTLLSDLYESVGERKSIYDGSDVNFYKYVNGEIPQVLKNYLKKCFIRYFFYNSIDNRSDENVLTGGISVHAFAAIEALNFLKILLMKNENIIEEISTWNYTNMQEDIQKFLESFIGKEFKMSYYPFFMDAYLPDYNSVGEYINYNSNPSGVFASDYYILESVHSVGGGNHGGGATTWTTQTKYRTNACKGAFRILGSTCPQDDKGYDVNNFKSISDGYSFDVYNQIINKFNTTKGYSDEYKKVFNNENEKIQFSPIRFDFFFKHKDGAGDGNYDGGLRHYQDETEIRLWNYSTLYDYITALINITNYSGWEICCHNDGENIYHDTLSEEVVDSPQIREFFRGFFGELDDICSELDIDDLANFNTCGFREMYGIECFLYGAMFKSIDAVADCRGSFNEFVDFCMNYYDTYYTKYRDSIIPIWENGFTWKDGNYGYDNYEDWEYHKFVFSSSGLEDLINKVLKGKIYFVNFTMTSPFCLTAQPNSHDVVYGIMGSEGNNPILPFINAIRTYCLGIKNVYEDVNYESTSLKKTTVAPLNALLSKKNIYYSFKELYDRWTFGKIGDNDFQTIKLYNHLYENIDDKVYLDIKTIKKIFKKIMFNETDISLYAFIYELLNELGITLLTLPFNIFETKETTSFEKMLSPYSYEEVMNNIGCSETLIGLYNEGASTIPSLENNFLDDSDALDFITENFQITSDKKIPVINVRYGDLENRFFNNIEIGTQKPRVTAESIKSEMRIAESGGDGEMKEEAEIKNANLYKINQQRSFFCKIKMLGCAQISPLMYFQINSIPMFNGGYLIDSVEHTINEKGMVTTFSGYRASRYRPEIKGRKEKVEIEELKNIVNNDKINKEIKEKATSDIPNAVENKNKYNMDDTTIIILPMGTVYDSKESLGFSHSFNKVNASETYFETTVDDTKDGVLDSLRPNYSKIKGLNVIDGGVYWIDDNGAEYLYEEGWEFNDVTSEQLDFVIKHEGFRPHWYRDEGENRKGYSIGYAFFVSDEEWEEYETTKKTNNELIKRYPNRNNNKKDFPNSPDSDRMTEADAKKWLDDTVIPGFIKDLKNSMTTSDGVKYYKYYNNTQMGGLFSLIYNVGQSVFSSAKSPKMHRALQERDIEGICREMNQGDSRHIKRRNNERALIRTIIQDPNNRNNKQNYELLSTLGVHTKYGLPNIARYRNYWGNRKLAQDLQKKLYELGCKKVKILNSLDRDSENCASYRDINKIYEQDNNCIVIGLDSDNVKNSWVDSNLWKIYCQGTEYVVEDGKNYTPNFANTSYCLAVEIYDKVSLTFPKTSLKYSEAQTSIPWEIDPPETFKQSYNGVNPLTRVYPPSVLIHTLNSSSYKGIAILGSKEHRGHIAECYANGIVSFLKRDESLNAFKENIIDAQNDG